MTGDPSRESSAAGQDQSGFSADLVEQLEGVIDSYREGDLSRAQATRLLATAIPLDVGSTDDSGHQTIGPERALESYLEILDGIDEHRNTARKRGRGQSRRPQTRSVSTLTKAAILLDTQPMS